MSVTMPRMMLMACLLSVSSLWPSLSWALGLGEIHLYSALNEPMNAEIDLIAATPDELTAFARPLPAATHSPLRHRPSAVPVVPRLSRSARARTVAMFCRCIRPMPSRSRS